MAGKGKVPSATSSTATGVISRSISACNRCRARKTKCDQLFPSCTACTRADVECVGIDAATGREIPRSYVDWLERRVKHLEGVLELKKDGDGEEETSSTPGEGKGAPATPEDAEGGVSTASDTGRSASIAEGSRGVKRGSVDEDVAEVQTPQPSASAPPPPPRQPSNGIITGPTERHPGELRLRPDIENLIDQVGVVGVQGTSATGFLGGSSGISFARLMFSAVKMQSGTEQSGPSLISPPSTTAPPRPSPPDASITSTTVPRSRQRAPAIAFPDPHTAEQLIDTYFQQANPQFPILHRPSFEPILRRVIARVEVGFNDIKISSEAEQSAQVQHSADLYFTNMCFAIATAMSSGTADLPERYHATAMQHMDSVFSSISISNNRLDGLKGLLLLALYSMMRPAAPGVWYVLGAALRLAVDLGLHQENPLRAERQWDPVALDERRRLFWCTYSVDRQVCVYIGRPFGISDDAINTPFPADVSDECITPQGILPEQPGKRSSRTISIIMFRIRKLQSEIQQVLYQVSELPRKFRDLKEWRDDMQARLQKWYDDVPRSRNEAGSGFNLGFVDLNYQQTRLLLYGLTPAIPRPSVDSLAIIADSGSRIIQAYGNLHRQRSINYTWLACHNLFMAGTSYLCALWHSSKVRISTNIEQIEANARTSVEVLGSMIDRCPAALTCRDVFQSLAQATVDLCRKELGLQARGTIHQDHHRQQHAQHPSLQRRDSQRFSSQQPPQKRMKMSNGQDERSPSQPSPPQFPSHSNSELYHRQPQPPAQRQTLPNPQHYPQAWTPPSDAFFPSSPLNHHTPANLSSASQPQSPSNPQSYQQQQVSTPISPPTPQDHPAPAFPTQGFCSNYGQELHVDMFAASQTPWVDLGTGGQMQPMVDGNRFFEMIREVGAVGGWDGNLAAGGAGMGWGFESVWGM